MPARDALHEYVVYGSRTWGINLVWAGLTNQGEGYKRASVPLDREGLIWTGYQKLHSFIEAFVKQPTGVTRTYLNLTYFDR